MEGSKGLFLHNRRTAAACFCSAFGDAQADPDLIPQDLLRKYLTYAKQNCRPQLQQADYDKIQQVRAECAAPTPT